MLRTVERVSPLALFGRPWNRLELAEQLELLGFATLREAEEAQAEAATFDAMRKAAR